MRGNPPPGFARAKLDIVSIPVGTVFGRLHHKDFADPLGFGKRKSRFSDPRKRVERNRYGVLYLGSTLAVCFLETVLRDRRNGRAGDYPIELREIMAWRYARIVVNTPLMLANLTGNGPIRMGIPTDVVGASAQGLAQRWSLAIHAHKSAPDGLRYPSRLNEDVNLAIYDRAIPKLGVDGVEPLNDAPDFAQVLDEFKIALVR